MRTLTWFSISSVTKPTIRMKLQKHFISIFRYIQETIYASASFNSQNSAGSKREAFTMETRGEEETGFQQSHIDAIHHWNRSSVSLRGSTSGADWEYDSLDLSHACICFSATARGLSTPSASLWTWTTFTIERSSVLSLDCHAQNTFPLLGTERAILLLSNTVLNFHFSWNWLELSN